MRCNEPPLGQIQGHPRWQRRLAAGTIDAMTETPSSASARERTATQPPGMTERLRMLRRSRSDRVVAGVLGGLGRQLGIDPLILRVVTAVLAVFGGVGILLYAIAWLLTPADDDPASVLDQAIGRHSVRDASSVPLALGLGAVIVITSAVIFGSWNGMVLLVLSAVGLHQVLKRRSEGPPATSSAYSETTEPPYWFDMATQTSAWHPTPRDGAEAAADSQPSAPAAADEPTPPDAADTRADAAVPPGEPADETTATGDDDAAGVAAEQPAPSATPLPTPTSAGWPEGPDWGVYGPNRSPYDLHVDSEAATPAAVEPARAAKPARPRSPLGWLTVCTAFVAVGSLAVADAIWATEPGALYIALPLVIVALGLLIGTWYGRSRWLILLGVLLTIALVPATLFTRWDAAAGRYEPVAPTSVSELPTEALTHGMGELSYDLSQLELNDDVDVTLQMGLGNMTVVVPANADVVVNGSVGFGSYEVFGQSADGVGRSSQVSDEGPDGPGGGRLELNLELGVGSLEVIRASEEVGS